MNKNIYILMVCIVGMVLSACSPSAPATQEIQPTATETLIPIATDTPGPTMTPSITPTPVLSYAGKLVYASNQDGDYEIFVITAQTGQPEQLTHNDGDLHQRPVETVINFHIVSVAIDHKFASRGVAI